MTGWGQDGPLSHAAGHDINYIALSGALHTIGRKGERPCLRSIWSAILVAARFTSRSGVVAALLEAQKSGKGQLIDVSMVEARRR